MDSCDSAGVAERMTATVQGAEWEFVGERLRFRGGFSDDATFLSGTRDSRAGPGSEWTPLMRVELRKRSG